jgi:hypothetical protein
MSLMARDGRFLDAAVPRPEDDHGSGDAVRARSMLAREPSIATANIYTASVLGDAETVAALLADEPSLSRKKGGPRDWEPLLYLVFSYFLREAGERPEGFMRSARLLLDQGADPNAFFLSGEERESVLYGAAGVANNSGIARILLEAGANPNDDEAVYHAAAFEDLSCIGFMVNRGLKLNDRGTALLRKLDFDDYEGVWWLLSAGADPNAGVQAWGKTALHQAVLRGRDERFVDLLLEHGADVQARTAEGKTACDLALELGRSDIVDILRAWGA